MTAGKMSSGAKLRDCCERSQETLTDVSVRNAEAMNSFVVMPNLETGKNLEVLMVVATQCSAPEGDNGLECSA